MLILLFQNTLMENFETLNWDFVLVQPNKPNQPDPTHPDLGANLQKGTLQFSSHFSGCRLNKQLISESLVARQCQTILMLFRPV